MFALFFTVVLFFAACTKTDIQPSNKVAADKTVDNLSAVQMRTNYITAHVWKYQGWYFQT